MTSLNNNPLVTVCIPSYNHARFVAESIQGIIDQTYQNIELIIIDDGSSDNSVEIIESFREACAARFSRFEIRSRPNKGLSATLNEALAWGEGKYFSPIASDDIALPDKTAILVAASHDTDWIVGVFGGVEEIDEAGNVLRTRSAAGIWGFADILMAKAYLPAPTSMLHLRKLVEAGGFDEGLMIEDWSMWLKLTHGGASLRAVGDVVARYRLHADNSYKRHLAMHEARLKILQKYKDHPLYDCALSKATMDAARALSRNSPRESLRLLASATNAPFQTKAFIATKALAPRMVLDCLYYIKETIKNSRIR